MVLAVVAKDFGVGTQKIMDAGDVEGSYIIVPVLVGGMTMTRPARSKRYALSRCIWEFQAREFGRVKMERDRLSWNRIMCQEVADVGAGEIRFHRCRTASGFLLQVLIGGELLISRGWWTCMR